MCHFWIILKPEAWLRRCEMALEFTMGRKKPAYRREDSFSVTHMAGRRPLPLNWQEPESGGQTMPRMNHVESKSLVWSQAAVCSATFEVVSCFNELVYSPIKPRQIVYWSILPNWPEALKRGHLHFPKAVLFL